jgi:hypothetical protein
VLAALTDAIMGALVMECVSLRAARIAATSRAEFTADIAAVINHTTLRTVEDAARLVLSACREGDELRISLAAFKRLAKAEPVDLIAARRRIAGGMGLLSPMRLCLTAGLPASGKSTWLREQALPALSSDTARALLSGMRPTRTSTASSSAPCAVCAPRASPPAPPKPGSTPPRSRWWERRCWIRWAELHGCTIECAFFDVPLGRMPPAQCRARAHRPGIRDARDGGAVVPPSLDEGFDRVRVLRPGYDSSAII